MKVLHLPTEIAGQVSLSAKGLREIGVDAYNTARPNPYGYPVDIDPRITWLPFLRDTRDPFLFFKWIEEFDLFHYHKSPYLPLGFDVKLLKNRNIPFVVEFWGSDIRLNELEEKRNPYFRNVGSGNSIKTIRRLKFWADQTDEVIMCDNTHDIFLKPYFKKIHAVGQRVDTVAFPPNYPSLEQKRPRIVHAPSSSVLKGSVYVKRAIDKLKKVGLDFDYIEVTGVSHRKAMQIYSEADIIVDQLILGCHGVFACEAMALGKPVICYLLDEHLAKYPRGIPIVNANPDNLYGVLEELICSPKKRREIGIKGRFCVEKNHDIKVVAQKLLTIYSDKLEGAF